MTQYAGTAKLATTVPLPDANTPFNASAVAAPIAANRDSIVAHETYGLYRSTFNSVKPPYPLAGSHVNSGTYILAVGSQTRLEFSAAKTYTRAAHGYAWTNGTTWDFSYNNVPPKALYRQDVLSAVASTDAATFFFELPSLCTLKYAKIRIDPADTHGGIPVTIPRIEVYIGDNSTGVTTLIASADGYNGTGTYADLAQYQAPHNIIADLSSTAFDAGVNTLFLKLYGEDDGNAMVDLLAYIPWIEYERTRFGEEFGALVP